SFRRGESRNREASETTTRCYFLQRSRVLSVLYVPLKTPTRIRQTYREHGIVRVTCLARDFILSARLLEQGWCSPGACREVRGLPGPSIEILAVSCRWNPAPFVHRTRSSRHIP